MAAKEAPHGTEGSLGNNKEQSSTSIRWEMQNKAENWRKGTFSQSQHVTESVGGGLSDVPRARSLAGSGGGGKYLCRWREDPELD